ncbi:MAG: hypothetical protein OEZ68_01860 [Gammaproteobacteria bacterium]|nr:hypothetical protein [Gammaproteobacteria bacterium]MDH5799526.1 hypothetical protein [Gammaproteobacteria bacterium]
MNLGAIVTLKNDGAVYLLDSLSPDQYFTRQNLACALISQSTYDNMSYENELHTDISMNVYNLSNGTSVGRIKYKDTLYHLVWGNEAKAKETATVIGKFIAQKSHSRQPALQVVFNGFNKHTHDLGTVDYKTITISDLAHDVITG